MSHHCGELSVFARPDPFARRISTIGACSGTVWSGVFPTAVRRAGSSMSPFECPVTGRIDGSDETEPGRRRQGRLARIACAIDSLLAAGPGLPTPASHQVVEQFGRIRRPEPHVPLRSSGEQTLAIIWRNRPTRHSRVTRDTSSTAAPAPPGRAATPEVPEAPEELLRSCLRRAKDRNLSTRKSADLYHHYAYELSVFLSGRRDR